MDGSHITNDIEKLLADFDFDASKADKKRTDSEKDDALSSPPSGSEGVVTRPASAGCAAGDLAEGLKRMSSSLSSSSQELSSLGGGRNADEGDSTGE